MPTYRFSCGCGADGEFLVLSPDEIVRCACGGRMDRHFSPTTNLRLAEYAKRENEDSRAAHRRWLETPEVQAKLKSGEFVPDSSDRSCDNGNGVGNSSSITARLEAGLPLS